MMKRSWLIVIFQVLILAAIQMRVRAYKILVIPAPGKSHIFQLAAMSESLVNKGHQVLFFAGESYHVNLPELRNRAEFSIVRYRDLAKGAHAKYNYDDMEKNLTKSALDSSGDVNQVLSTFSIMYVCIYPSLSSVSDRL